MLTLVSDTAVSVLAAFAIFPIVFAENLDPSSGPGLVFITLPLAFSHMPFGAAAAVAFFVLLLVAAIGSAISFIELAAGPLQHALKCSRTDGEHRMWRGELDAGNCIRVVVQRLGGLVSTLVRWWICTRHLVRSDRSSHLERAAASGRLRPGAVRRLGAFQKTSWRRNFACAELRSPCCTSCCVTWSPSGSPRRPWRSICEVVNRPDQTVATAVPGLDTSASRAAFSNGWSGGRMTDAERTRWCARSTPGGVGALFRQRLRRPHQAMTRHDDAVVGRDQVFLGAVDDRPHAFLQRRILHGNAFHAAVGLAALLRLAVDQVVVVLVGHRSESAGHG